MKSAYKIITSDSSNVRNNNVNTSINGYNFIRCYAEMPMLKYFKGQIDFHEQSFIDKENICKILM